MVIKNDLISGLISLLNDEDKAISQKIINCLAELDYKPHRQKVRGYVLSFKNRKVGQVIAKIGVHYGKNRVFFSLKFFACKNPPDKYKVAIKNAIAIEKERYACVDCGVCKIPAIGRGYFYTYEDGRTFKRCSTYVIEIPDLHLEDVDSINELLKKQHHYFLSLIQGIGIKPSLTN